MPFASDDFTDSNGVVLESHTPSGGGTWTKVVGAAGVDMDIRSNQLTPSGNYATYYHSASPASAEYDVEFTRVAAGDSNATICVCGRIDTGVSTGTFYHTWHTASTHYLYKRVAGTFTELGTWVNTPAANDVVKLEIRDATKRVFINGTQRISSTNNDITAAGKAGVIGYGTVTTHYADNWSASDVEGGAAIAAKPRIIRQAVNRASTY